MTKVIVVEIIVHGMQVIVHRGKTMVHGWEVIVHGQVASNTTGLNKHSYFIPCVPRLGTRQHIEFMVIMDNNTINDNVVTTGRLISKQRP